VSTLKENVFEVVNCPFCDSADFHPVTGHLLDSDSHYETGDALAGKTYQMVQCEECSTVYLRERPVKEELWRFYSDRYHCFEDFEKRGPIMSFLAQLVLKLKIRQIDRYFPSGNNRLLDYGCGSGTWLQMLKNSGCSWSLVGSDIVPKQIASLREKNIEAYVADETQILEHVAPNSVGVIHLFHVIEHVPSPLKLLETLRQLLVPGGVIVGQTPNHQCLEQRIFGDYWWQWHVPRHTVIFSPETMRAHAQKAGLEVVELKSSPSGATQWAASWLKKGALQKGRDFRGTREPLYPPLVLLAAPFSTLQVLTGGNTSHMDFVLRKES
jgi:2-polyprenyl-3-methyl-5-hydroxy-6-metoxy-1,4-benzoquinol methylase